MQDLVDLGGAWAEATDINDMGQVTGGCGDNPDGPGAAVLWQFIDMPQSVDPPDLQP